MVEQKNRDPIHGTCIRSAQTNKWPPEGSAPVQESLAFFNAAFPWTQVDGRPQTAYHFSGRG